MLENGLNPEDYGFIDGDGMSYSEVLALAVAGLAVRVGELEGRIRHQ